MPRLTRIKTISDRFKNFILAMAFIATQLFVPYIISGTASAASGDLTVGSFEGQNSNGTWSPGNNTQFAEGDYVNYRFPVTSSANNTSGVLYVKYSTCMFTNYFALYDSTSPATVTPGTKTTSGSDWSQKLTIAFPTAGTTTVHFTLRISDTGGECNGSSSHVSLDTKQQDKGDFGNIGSKDIPIPADSIYYSPSLTITKTVESGTAKPSDFWFTVSPAVNGQTEIHLPDSGTATSSVTITDVNPDGTFVITEHGPAGYQLDEANSSGTNCNVTGSDEMTATVTAGRPAIDATCAFSNVRSSGTLVVKKNVINDNGGTKTYQDFGFKVGDGSEQSFDADSNDTNGEDGLKTLSLPTGTYSVTEPEANSMGYATTYNSCTNVTVVAGQTATCTITNNDVAPLLMVTKHAINDNGGTKMATDFKLYVNGALQSDARKGGGDVSDSSVTYEHGNTMANTEYTISEDSTSGYAKVSTVCVDKDTQAVVAQPVKLQLGQTVECTITNNDIAPTLTLLKTVNNGYGGNATANDFPVYIGQTLSSWGSSHTLNAGTFTVSENASAVSGYSAGDWGGDCAANGSVTLNVGDNKTCTITNSQLPASISGYKYEVGPTATAGDNTGTPLQNWTIYLLVNGRSIASTTTNNNGYYEFTGLDWGDYALAECTSSDSCSGWTQIYRPNSITVNGDSLTSDNNDFGNFQNGSISGYKFNDLNGDGTKQENEPKLANWPFSYVYDANDDGQFNETATNFSTDQNGNFTLSNLKPGKYQVCEDPQTALGWTRTAPSSSNCRTRTIDVSGESATDLVFGNQAHGTLTVIKNVDDGFGNVTSNTSGWTWDYTGNYQNGSNETAGSTHHVVVPADTYTLNEDQQTNYHFTSVTCTNNGDNFSVDQGESTTVTVTAGDNVVCTFTNTRDTGYVSVTKYLDPEDDNGLFDLQVNGHTEYQDATYGDTTGDVKVVTGNGNTVSELAGTDTDMSNYDSVWFCYSPDSFYVYGEGTVSDSFAVNSNNQHVYCYFYNVRHATLTVIKDATPNDPQPFNFTLEKYNRCNEVNAEAITNLTQLNESCDDYTAVDNFQLVDNGDPSLANKTESLSAADIFSESEGVTYRITEADTPGWKLTDLTCGDVEVSYDGSSALLTVYPGQNITCTYTNTKLAKVTVVKDAQPDSLQAFKFTSDLTGKNADFSLTDSTTLPGLGSKSFDSLMPGTYHISEASLSGWNLKSISCGDATMTQDGTDITLTVKAGDDITCTFVNVKKAGHVLGASTELPNTGQSALVNFIAGAMIMSLALAVRWFGRKSQVSTL